MYSFFNISRSAFSRSAVCGLCFQDTQKARTKSLYMQQIEELSLWGFSDEKAKNVGRELRLFQVKNSFDPMNKEVL